MGISSFLVVAVCFSCALVSATIPYAGECPDPKVQEDFNLQQFLGTWNEIERTVNLLEFGAKCVTVSYEMTDDMDGSIDVTHEGRGPILGIKGKVRLVANPSVDNPAKMEIRLIDLNIPSKYYILRTDYVNYALVWSCRNIWPLPTLHNEDLWILSRHKSMSEELTQELYDVLEKEKIASRKLLVKVRQSGC